ncbi:MAG: hypothetical protein IJI05_01660, partial [Erysipelotrichaceae bacterium]|nr:hypothetical protein [Erysipelotrichaceae bacterium]
MTLDNTALLIITGALSVVTLLIVVLLINNSRNQMLQQSQKQISDLHLDITREMGDFQLNITNAIKGDLSTLNESAVSRMDSIERQVSENLRT